MEAKIDHYLEKMEKRKLSSDPLKRMKCVRDFVKHMKKRDIYIREGTECLVDMLEDSDVDVRLATLNACEDIISTVMKKLEEKKNFTVKYRGKEVAIRKLLFFKAIRRTKDDDKRIRLEAVRIAGDSSLRYKKIRKRATPFLVVRLNDPEKEIRTKAAGYTVKIALKTPGLLLPYITRIYSKKRKKSDSYVAYILSKITLKKPFPEFTPLLFSKLEDAEEKEEKNIIESLVNIGMHDMETLKDYLITGLTDQSYALWWLEARNMLIILRGIAEKMPEKTRPYLRHIIPLLTVENWELRKEAVMTTGVMGEGNPNRVKEALPTLIDLTNDADNMVIMASTNALENIGISELDYTIVQDAAISLNEARLKLIEVKRNGDVTDKIRDSYVLARKNFTDKKYRRSYEFAEEALAASVTRLQLRKSAKNAITDAEKIYKKARREGINVSTIKNLVENAKSAFDEQKYFLARELISRGEKETSRLGNLSSYSGLGNNLEKFPSVSETLICHVCGEEIPRENTICTGCGTRLDSTICPRCQQLVPQGYLFCGNCGLSLDNVCEVCGAINPKNSDNCTKCGEPLQNTLLDSNFNIPSDHRKPGDREIDTASVKRKLEKGELDVELVQRNPDVV